MAEPVLINNLVSEEEKKLYKVQFKRPIKLIYSFFKEGTLPFVF